MMGGFLDEGVEEELRRAFHGRIDLRQIFFVASKEVMFPQILAEPCAAQRPQAGIRPVNRRGRAPQVGVVVSHPAAGVVIHLGRAGAGLRQVHDHRGQRRDAFGKVRNLRGPVIHLRVDVDGVFAAPRRVHGIVPDALEIRGLAARTRAGDEQVARELEIQRGELRVVALGEMRDALVGRQLHGVRLAQVEFHAAEPFLVFGHMRLEQAGEGFPPGGGNLFLGDGLGIAADILVIFITGGGGDEQGGGVCAGECQAAHAPGEFPAPGQDAHARLKFQSAPDALRVAVDAAHHERVRAFGRQRRRLGRVHAGGEGYLTGLVGSEAHDNNLIYRAGKDFALEVNSVGRVADGGDRGVQIQVAPILFNRRIRGEIQEQVSDGLVRHLAERFGHHVAGDEAGGRVELACEYQLANFWQRGEGVGVVGIVGPAGPEGVFVELQMFPRRAAEDHRAEPSVANGQGAGPVRCRRAVPERERRGGVGCGAGLKSDKHREDGEKRAVQYEHQMILVSPFLHSS